MLASTAADDSNMDHRGPQLIIALNELHVDLRQQHLSAGRGNPEDILCFRLGILVSIPGGFHGSLRLVTLLHLSTFSSSSLVIKLSIMSVGVASSKVGEQLTDAPQQQIRWRCVTGKGKCHHIRQRTSES